MSSDLLNSGNNLSSATDIISKSFQVNSKIFPMTNSDVKTILITKKGEFLSFQEYFVKYKCEPKIIEILYNNIDNAIPNADFIQALDQSTVLIICPSNPYLSIGPIINMPKIKTLIKTFQGNRIAVSPIVGDKAVKGPAAKIIEELGEYPSCYTVAKYYKGICDIFVIDEIDYKYESSINDLGMKTIILPTVMNSFKDKTSLAKNILSAVKQ